MRSKTFSAGILVVASTLACAAPSTAQDTDGGGGIHIFRCAAPGSKQEVGAIIGGVLGGVIGNRVAGSGNRTLGTLVGGALGAAAGQAIGCKMQKKDLARAEKATQDALAKNQNQSWKSPETGASGTVEVTKAASVSQADLSDISFAKNVEPADGYSKVGAAYVSTTKANVRSAPNTSSAIVGELASGTRVWVPASVSNAPWMLISQEGKGVGYVSNTLLKRAADQTASAGNCKTVKQTVNVPGAGSGSETYQACKGADGQWTMTRV